jgi:polyhydroxyalkanoate synthesis regulator phasin
MKGGETHMTSKKLLVPVMALTLSGALFLGISGTASANYDDSGNYSSLVKKLADKLNLSEVDVQSALDAVLNEDETTVNEKLGARLDELVANGKITVDQKQSILDKLDELREKKDSMDWKNMTYSERREAIKALKKDLVEWAQANNLDLKLLVELSLGLGEDSSSNATISLSL